MFVLVHISILPVSHFLSFAQCQYNECATRQNRHRNSLYSDFFFGFRGCGFFFISSLFFIYFGFTQSIAFIRGAGVKDTLLLSCIVLKFNIYVVCMVDSVYNLFLIIIYSQKLLNTRP